MATRSTPRANLNPSPNPSPNPNPNPSPKPNPSPNPHQVDVLCEDNTLANAAASAVDIHKAAASVKAKAGDKGDTDGDTDDDGEQCANPGSRRWVLRLARSGARLVSRRSNPNP